MSADLLLGDCLERMAEIPDGSVDMVMCDLPYGTTACKWDSVIPFAPLWVAYRRVCKPRAAIVLTACQPFTSALVMSNPSMFKYDWCWEKTAASGHLNAKKMPMRAHESVLVFCEGTPLYIPQKTKGHPRKVSTAEHKRNCKATENYGAHGLHSYDSTERYPRSIVKFSSDKQKSALHSTQKPVALMEYLIRTYSNEGDTVLDNTMGSGTTGVACINTGRNFIGIERDEKYFAIAKARIEAIRAPAIMEVD
jgi:site-specific DNA-methyltransferase (adenine-specific)